MMMAWSEAEKKWAREILRSHYSGMAVGTGITEADVESMVFGDLEADRRAVATTYAQTVIKPRLEASLTALDDQASLVEADIAAIPAI
jgi:hypothetical protein